jgi:hypothetical protein
MEIAPIGESFLPGVFLFLFFDSSNSKTSSNFTTVRARNRMFTNT